MKLVEYPNKTFMAKLERHENAIHDSTAMKVFMQCPRKYFYRMVLGYVPLAEPYAPVFDFGKAYHKFRELLELEYQNSGDSTAAYKKALEYVLAVKLPIQAPKSKWIHLDHTRLLITCQKAFDHWLTEKKNGKMEVIGVELPFNIAMPDGEFIGGRADQVIRWQGALWVRDWKTTSKNETYFPLSLDPADQPDRYIYGFSRLYGKEVQGIIFECVYNDKTNGPKIFTSIQSRTKYQQQQWEKTQIDNHRRLKVYQETDDWPMHTFNCQWCEYASVCRKPTEGSMAAKLQSDFQKKPWDFNNVEQEGE